MMGLFGVFILAGNLFQTQLPYYFVDVNSGFEVFRTTFRLYLFYTMIAMLVLMVLALQFMWEGKDFKTEKKARSFSFSEQLSTVIRDRCYMCFVVAAPLGASITNCFMENLTGLISIFKLSEVNFYEFYDLNFWGIFFGFSFLRLRKWAS